MQLALLAIHPPTSNFLILLLQLLKELLDSFDLQSSATRYALNLQTILQEVEGGLQPLLPKPSPKGGRPANDHRPIINGILWILRTGAP